MEKVLTKKDIKRMKSRESYWGSVMFRMKKNKMAVVSLFILVAIVLACIFVPILSSHEIASTNTDHARQPPCSRHWLGTDDLGRDMFVRFFYAGRISLGIGLVVTILISIVGTILGAISGFYGKAADAIIMRLCEMFMCFPFLMTCIVVAGFFGNTIPVLIAILTVLSWPLICRIVRGQILALRDLEYMQACEAVGLSSMRRMFRHLLPNVLAYVVVYATLSLGGIILTETALSFLGLGVAPPTPTWGNLIQEARSVTVLRERWWYWIPPGLAIFITVMCINLMGDGLRDAIDPKMTR